MARQETPRQAELRSARRAGDSPRRHTSRVDEVDAIAATRIETALKFSARRGPRLAEFIDWDPQTSS
jgi:hypothetical protein